MTSDMQDLHSPGLAREPGILYEIFYQCGRRRRLAGLPRDGGDVPVMALDWLIEADRKGWDEAEAAKHV